jgi:hypothetical protein
MPAIPVQYSPAVNQPAQRLRASLLNALMSSAVIFPLDVEEKER